MSSHVSIAAKIGRPTRTPRTTTELLAENVGCLAILDAAGGSSVSAFPVLGESASFLWRRESVLFAHDWAPDQGIFRSLSDFDGVALRGFSLLGLESVFRLRALQLLDGQACLKIPSAVFVEDIGEAPRLVRGFGRRVVSSWPFQSVVFVADDAAAAALSAEGLTVVKRSKAAKMSVQDLLGLPRAVRSEAAQDQGIGVQIQPPWGRCGSSTAFANQLETLNDGGLFTIRAFIDHQLRWGPTAMRRLAESIPENRIDSAPHLETFASADGEFPQAPENELAEFEKSVRIRTRSTICDRVARDLALRAQVVIVNRAVSVGFAAHACPQARVVLDTHDHLTRNAVARLKRELDAFPDWGTLRRHLALEHRLWRAADVCTTPSLDEEGRIRRAALAALLVLPEPYVEPWTDPGLGAEWDALIVADDHAFNVRPVSWMLEKVISPDARLRGLKIAVVGRVQRALEHLWSERLPSVKWLGYVADLDGVRNASRIAVCPDRGGTGISVKLLTALAAGQPVVVTSASLRGFPKAVAEFIPVADDPAAMGQDILRLLDDPAEARARRDCVERASRRLHKMSGYSAAIDLACVAPAGAAEARRSLVADFAAEPASSPLCLSFDRHVARLAFNTDGNAADFLGMGWHEPEVWGRWMDGDHSTLRVPASSISSRTMVHVQFCDFQRPIGVSVSCGGRVLTPPGLTTAAGRARLELSESMKDPEGEAITLEFRTDSTTCPREADGSEDSRVLGAGIESLIFTQESDAFRAEALTISFSSEGNAAPFIGQGWYGPEPWGRWMHGAWATLRLPASWFDTPAKVEIQFAVHRASVPVSVSCRSRVLTPRGATTEGRGIEFTIDPTMRDPSDEYVTIEIQALTTVCPHDLGWNTDRRILDAGVESVTITRLDAFREALQTAEPYAAWCRATFGEVVPKPGVLHAAKFPDNSIWSHRTHDALLGVELDYVASLLREIRDTEVPGALVEFGIFKGWWLDKLFELSEEVGLHRPIIGYDSFAGLSAPHPIYDSAFWKKGQYAASQEIVAAHVKLAERDRLQLIPGFFADSLTTEPATGVGPIAYARIDCDIYEPTLECLRYLTPRLSHGAVLVFDDWPHSLDIGEGRAFYEWALTVPNLRFEFLSFCTWGHFYIRVWRRNAKAAGRR